MHWQFVVRGACAVVATPLVLFIMRFFQQTGYSVARGYCRIVLSRCFVSALICGVLLIPADIYWERYSVTVLLVCVTLLAGIAFSVKAKVPLRFTPRAVRLLVLTSIALLATFLFLPCCVLPIMPFFVVPLGAFVLFPLERTIHKKYIRQAKKKLVKATYVKIAVTGSFGKTSVKNILTEILSTKYKTYCTPKSFNTPLGIASFVNNELPCDAQAVVFEMGAKKKGDINYLCKMVEPRYAILTGIGNQHLSTFGNIENVVSAKGELLNNISSDGLCVLNADNIYTRKLVGICPSKTVGKAGDTVVSDIKISTEGTSFFLKIDAKESRVKTCLLGKFNAENIALAATLAYELGVSFEQIVAAIYRLKPIPHRLELISCKNGWSIIDDSYNGNISGVRGALEVLAQFSGKKYIIAQGIVELGREQFDINFNLGKELAEVCDAIVTLGQNRKALSQGVRAAKPNADVMIVDTVEEAVSLLSPKLNSKDVILFQNDLPDSMIK